MLDIIFLTILIISLLGVFFIVSRKFVQLKSIDTSIITKEIQDKQKSDLLKNRLDRKIRGYFKKENGKKSRIKETQNKVNSSIKRYETINEYNFINKISKEPEKRVFYMNELAEDIKKNIDNKEYLIAEELCFQYLKLDKDNVNALEMLASIYNINGSKQKAIQTYEYIVSILKKTKNKDNLRDNNQKIVKFLIKVADIYLTDLNYKKIADVLKNAFLIDENNPKILDLLIESYINLKDRFMAERTLKKMEEANPENLKIIEFRDRIEKMFTKK